MDLTLIDQLSPALVLTLQHDAEAYLPWHHQAQRREVEQNVVHARRQSQAIRQVVRLAIRGDLLDVDWRRQRVKAGTRRTEEAHRVPVDKPDFAVGRLGDRGPSPLEDRNQPYSIVGIEGRYMDRSLGIGDPGLHVALPHMQESGLCVKPVRKLVVFNDPVNGLAGQPVRRGQRCDAPVLYARETILGCGPDRAIASTRNVEYPAGTCRVVAQGQVAYLSRSNIGHPAAQQSSQDAAVRVGHEAGSGAATQLLPMHLLNDFSID